MDKTNYSLTTTIDRENNPKAVFFGSDEKILQPLATYLSSLSVDLYSGKTLEDAFFGNYFFYIGQDSPVKDFIIKNGKQLPKTLLIFSKVSDTNKIKEFIAPFSQIKVVTIGDDVTVDQIQARKIIDFFLGSKDLMLELGTVTKTQTLPVSAEFEDESFQEKNQPAESQIIESQPRVVKPDEQNKSIPAAADIPISNENITRVKNLFATSPKPTRAKASSFSKLRTIILRLAFLVIVIFIVLPVVGLTAGSALASFHIYRGKTSLVEADFEKADRNLTYSQYYLVVASKSLLLLRPIFDLTKQRLAFQGLDQLFEVGSASTNGLSSLAKATYEGQTLLGTITGTTKGVASAQILSEVKGHLTRAETQLGLAEANSKTSGIAHLFTLPGLNRLNDEFGEFKKDLSQVRNQLVVARQVLSIVPQVTGVFGKRTYLVVFQNNMELRPSGGFIGSFGLVTFEDGVLKDFRVEDIYTADGALKGHVDPPPAIRVHLGQEHWYMRDANWDPDFSQTGPRLIWFLDKELDLKVDGVIGIDINAIEYLLEATGPMELTDFNETISKDNLFLKLQTEVSQDFFPGSTTKRDILGALARSLVEKTLAEKDISQPTLIKKIHQALDEKHLLVYFSDPQAERLVGELGWAGKMGEITNCTLPNCISDYLLVVDANLGVNKVNYFIKRTINDQAILENGKLNHVLSVTYKNDSPADASLGGSYKNYVRVYLPSQTELTQAEVNSMPLKLVEGDLASSSSVVATTSANFYEISHLIEIPPQSQKTLTLRYQRNLAEDGGGNKTYVYKVQKQPGTIDDNLKLSINYPPNWQALDTLSQEGQIAGAVSVAKESQISYNSSLLKDQVFEVTFNQ